MPDTIPTDTQLRAAGVLILGDPTHPEWGMAVPLSQPGDSLSWTTGSPKALDVVVDSTDPAAIQALVDRAVRLHPKPPSSSELDTVVA